VPACPPATARAAETYAGRVLTGLAHTAICVPDVEAATRWYSEVLGLRVLSPPYRMEGAQIEQDMGELVPSPVVLTASIVGFGSEDRVIELIEYPAAPVEPRAPGRPTVTRFGITHVAMLCDDIVATRSQLESSGVEFLTRRIADVAGLKTTWCCDPWGTVIILLEKRTDARPYWGQLMPS
jgi:catechol 2,3-dioxygenase-like lactoylglutathione lyase family enzyme